MFSLYTDAGETVKTRTDIYLDELIPAIDEAVEKVENYSQRVMAEYGLA